MSLLDMIEGDLRPEGAQAEIFEMYSVVIKDFEDFQYEGDPASFRILRRGEAFAYQGGQLLTVTEDSYLLIPMKPGATRLHEDVCYLGRKVPAPGRPNA